ncbi:MAG: histone H1 [Bacteroidetes bacterium]|nr:histone H1 [Bacteroidota bacterium]
MSRQFERLQNFVNSLQDDFEKFYVKENKAAGTRIRKSMQELKSIAQEIRVEIQEKKNAS